MKSKISNGLLASTMLLSMVVSTLATEISRDGDTAMEQKSLSSNLASDFSFHNGIIEKYLGTEENVVIPSTINGEIVHTIGGYAFAHNDTITSVVIPDSVTDINQCAFSYCSRLTEVHIPESIVGVGFYLFDGYEIATIYGAASVEGYKQTAAEFVAQWNGLPFVETSIIETETILIPEDVYSPWAEPYVNQAKVYNLMTPTLGYYFNVDIIRVQIAELLVQLIENYTGEMLPQSDVVFQDSTEISVQKAYGAGIISGMGDGIFGITESASREQIALMMVKTIDVLEEKTGKVLIQRNADLRGFTDMEEVSPWAREAMGILVNNGIMTGVSDTELSPQGNTTIEQCFVMANKIFELGNG